jgi:hypothetical protein
MILGCALWWTENIGYDREQHSFVFRSSNKQAEQVDNTSKVEVPASSKKTSIASNGVEEAKHSSSSTNSINRISLIQALLESMLLRQGAFSTYTISEAVQSLSPAMCAVAMRILTVIIGGVHPHKRASLYLYFREEQVQRAVSWIEGFLDGHLVGFAIEASHQEIIRRALYATIHLVQNAQQALEYCEDLVGVSTHIDRVLNRKGSLVQTVDSLYRVEIVDI